MSTGIHDQRDIEIVEDAFLGRSVEHTVAKTNVPVRNANGPEQVMALTEIGSDEQRLAW